MKFILFALFIICFAQVNCAKQNIYPFELRCNNAANPLSVESACPIFSWKLKAEGRNVKQSAYRIIVSSGLNNINNNIGDYWDSGKILSSASINIPYKGKELTSRLKLYWKVIIWDGHNTECHSRNIQFFETGLLKQSDWSAIWIGAPCNIHPDSAQTGPAPYFRKKFTTKENIKSARLFVTAPGFYELCINGKKTGSQVLAPAQTNYDKRSLNNLLYPFDDQSSKRVLYNTFDVTSMLKKGENTLGIILGNGWYNQRDRVIEGNMWYDSPRFLLQLEITDHNGNVHVIKSDSTWKYSFGPLLHNGIFSGEVYDARLELNNWNGNGLNDKDWNYASVLRAPEGKLVYQSAPFDKVTRTVTPSFRQVNDSVYIYTAGETVSGWAQVKTSGKRGSKISMKFISEEGKTYGQEDTYILKGDGTELWEPRFTWHTFNRIEITSPSAKLNKNSITIKAVNTEVEQAGSFTCSNKLFNKIYGNYIRTQYANFHGSISSDCPHRERLGYTGDGQVLTDAAIYSFDMQLFYKKWFNDIADAQNKNTGYVPHTAPFGGGGGGPAWGSAMVIMPWKYYQAYGDTNIPARYYDNMKKWVNYLSTRTDERGIIVKEEPGGWCLGDWVTPVKIELPEPLVNTCYYYYTADIMQHIAGITGNKNDSVYFAGLCEKIKTSINNIYLDSANGEYRKGIQGANVFPLAFGIVPDSLRKGVFNSLIKNLSAADFHFDTGILATPLLLQVLSDNNRSDIAYRLMNQRNFPGYGYVIDSSTSCLWEEWNGKNSRCHPMFGSVTAWFFNTIAGIKIDPLSPGMQHFILSPGLLDSLTFCSASYKSSYGEITSKWETSDSTFIYNIKIPANTSADVYLPVSVPLSVTEKGTPLARINGISNVHIQNNKTCFRAESGSYSFIVSLRK